MRTTERSELSSVKNRTFRFKQFEVSDQHSAMKIGTDGVLLGAWTPLMDGETVWDVGAGSGLISLMLLQRGAGQVIASEIMSEAVKDIRRNAAASPWGERLTISEGDFSELWPSLNPRPTLIVSNPPFFKEDIRSPHAQRDKARHEATLNFGVLFLAASEVLPVDGRISMIAPANRDEELMFEGRLRKLYPRRLMYVTTVYNRQPSRVMIEFVKGQEMPVACESMLIRNADNTFSECYKSLTHDFYLDF